MRNKPNFKINMPEINAYILIIGIMSIMLLAYNLYLGGLFFFGFIYIVFHNWRIANFRKKEWNKYIQNLSLDMDETTKKAIMNLELIFYILFFIQGVSVAVFFGKKWLKSGQIIKFTMGVIAILVLGIMSISILGMIDTIFDFRRVKNCELI